MKRPNTCTNLIRAIKAVAADADAVRLTRQLANVIVGQMLPDGVIKGGSSLMFRYGSKFTRYTRDVDTAPVADGAFAVAGTCPVWRSQSGKMYGQAFEPLYATAPTAAAKDRELYDRLAVIDMLRGGRLRERRFAEAKITEMIS